jgi:hypothetical protein
MKQWLPFMILTLMLNIYCAFGQDQFVPNKGFSMAVMAGEYAYDPSVGLEFGSPGLFNNRICFKAKGMISALEEYKATFDHWATYKSLTISMVYNVVMINRSRIYVEMGPNFIFPSEKFSKEKSVHGFAGSIGTELFAVTLPEFNMCYYFSFGFGHTDAYADKLENQPGYGNGFIFNTGLRFYF